MDDRTGPASAQSLILNDEDIPPRELEAMDALYAKEPDRANRFIESENPLRRKLDTGGIMGNTPPVKQ